MKRILFIFLLLLTACTQVDTGINPVKENLSTLIDQNTTLIVQNDTTLEDMNLTNNKTENNSVLNINKTSEDVVVDNVKKTNLDLLVGTDLEIVGILQKRPEVCGGWCIWENTINSKEFGQVIILGNIDEEDSGKLVKASGKVLNISQSYIHGPSAPLETITFELYNYRLISNLFYHDFLIDASTNFMELRYGCTCSGPDNCPLSHNKNISWNVNNSNVNFIVRWTMFESEINPTPYIELSYDINGDLVNIEDEMGGYNPCSK